MLTTLLPLVLLLGILGRLPGRLVVWGGQFSVSDYVPAEAAAARVAQAGIGRSHVVVLTSASTGSGGVIAWGNNALGQTDLPLDITTSGASAIAVGDYHSLALRTDQSIAAWGDNSLGQVDIPQGLTNATAVAAFQNTSAAASVNGTVFVWGSGGSWSVDASKLGRNITSLAIATIRNVTAVVAASGSAQVGVWQKPGDSIALPGALTTLLAGADNPSVTLVSGGIDRIMVALSNGRFVVSNYTSRASTTSGGNANNWLSNPLFHGGAQLKSFQFNQQDDAFSFVLDNNNVQTINFKEGTPSEGQPSQSIYITSPDGSISMNDPVPTGLLQLRGSLDLSGYVPPAARTGVVKASFSDTLAAALTKTGQVVAWGVDSATRKALQVSIAARSGVLDIAAGSNHILYISQDGSVGGFGGANDQNQRSVPNRAKRDAVAVTTGQFQSYALLKDGTIVPFGQFSHNITSTFTNVSAVAASRTDVVVLFSNGTVYDSGAVVPDKARINVVQISASGIARGAVMKQGSYAFWGTGTVLTTTRQPNLTNVEEIAVARYTAVFKLQEGGLAFAADTDSDQATLPALLQAPGARVLSVAAGITGNAAIIEDASTFPSPPPPAVSSPSVAVGGVAAPGTSQTSHSKISGGAIAGIAVGVGAVVITIAVITIFIMVKRKQAAGGSREALIQVADMNSSTYDTSLPIKGVKEGDVFTITTARHYSWADNAAAAAALSTSAVHVEADVTAEALDSYEGNVGIIVDTAELCNTATAGRMPSNQPRQLSVSGAVQLSKQEVADQIQLLPDGLLGRGATALVFKCSWKSRFGPNAVLAAKVLENGFTDDFVLLESFCYEANVLSSCRHPNIVRLYGYCLEPPTVCLIMETLPSSLNDMLYKSVQPEGSTVNMLASDAQQAVKGLASDQILLLPGGNAKDQLTSASVQSGMSSRIGVGVASTAGSSTPATGSTTRGGNATSRSTDVIGQSAADFSWDTAVSSSSSQITSAGGQRVPVATKISMQSMLAISQDVAAALAYLHNRPLHGSHLHVPTAHNDNKVGSPQVDVNATNMTDASGLATVAESDVVLSLGAKESGTRVVHRDLKPANVLINSKGRAKISDFGLAREHQQTTIRTVHMCVGTLPYMAPELLVAVNSNSSNMPATNKVDIYSLSMMMWEMLSGHRPWQGTGQAALVSAVVSGQRPPMPRAKNKLPSADSEDIVGGTGAASGGGGGLKVRSSTAKDVPAMPAGFEVVPELNDIIRACWHMREHKRPTAAVVLDKIKAIRAVYNLDT